MRFVASLAAAVVSASGCATPTASPSHEIEIARFISTHSSSARQIGPPATLDPQPWKVGQWALYKSKGSHGELGYQKMSVVAEDSCGTWIEIEAVSPRLHLKWLMCLRRQASSPAAPTADASDLLQVLIVHNGPNPTTFDFRTGENAEHRHSYKGLVEALLPHQGLDDARLVREDIDVSAGHFAGALRQTEKVDGGSAELSQWFHPDVPFDAAVKRQVDGYELELLAFGNAGTKSVFPELAGELAVAMETKPTPRFFVAPGFGFGWLSGHGGESSSRAAAFTLRGGERVTPKLDLILEISGLLDARYSPDPTMTQQPALFLFGMRWSPLRPTRPRPWRFGRGASEIYLQAGLGYAELDRVSVDGNHVAARGFGVGAGVGANVLLGADWACGIELNDHLAFFNSGEGTRHSLSYMVLWQLYLRGL